MQAKSGTVVKNRNSELLSQRCIDDLGRKYTCKDKSLFWTLYQNRVVIFEQPNIRRLIHEEEFIHGRVATQYKVLVLLFPSS